MERHGTESYFVLGEGLLGEAVGGRERTLARAAELTTPPFRFSRMGPNGNGKQLPDATDQEAREGHDRGRGRPGRDPGRLHLPRPVHRPRPDLRQDGGLARRHRLPGRAPAGALPEPRPRLALRRGPGRSGVGEVLRGGRPAPAHGQDARGRRPRREAGLRPPARRRQHGREEAERDHPRPAKRREPRGRPDAPGPDPLPQPGRRHASRRRRACASVRDGEGARDQALPVDDPHGLPPADLRARGRLERLRERPEGLRGRRARRPTSRRCRSSSPSRPSGSGTR